MPISWSDILIELNKQNNAGPLPAGVSVFDAVRRKHLAALHKATGRNIILYATKWTQSPSPEPESISLTPEDKQGFMEVVNGLPPDKALDIVMHSPGGSAEAVESLVMFRPVDIQDRPSRNRPARGDVRGNDVRLRCESDRHGHSLIPRPIDPQFNMQTETGRAAVPAHAILAQFELAKKECSNPALLPAWIPMLKQYGPALLVQCQIAQDLARSLVKEWLQKYMLVNETDSVVKAEKAAQTLADHSNFKSHGRFIDREQARDLGLIVDNLEDSPAVENAVLGTFHATTHTFNGTAAVKIIESHQGKAYIKAQQMIQIGHPLPDADRQKH
jgi:hypothetical protein